MSALPRWIRIVIGRGVLSAVLGVVVVVAELVGPRLAVQLGLAEAAPAWKEQPLPYLTLGIALPLFATTVLSLLPCRFSRILACAIHLWILLLAALSVLAGLILVVTIMMAVAGLTLLLSAVVFGGNSVLSIVLALREVTAPSRNAAAPPAA